jgi:hypothetical protein
VVRLNLLHPSREDDRAIGSRLMLEDKPPPTCLICGKPVWPSDETTMVTRSVDEEGEQEDEAEFAGVAHTECWESREAGS